MVKTLPTRWNRSIFLDDWAKGDFDNSGQPIQIWRLDSKHYPDYYKDSQLRWDFLGIGQSLPNVDDLTKATKRGMIPNKKNARLQKVLLQQSKLLSGVLKQKVTLPIDASFLLLTDKNNTTYWAWEHIRELGGPTLGDNFHIMLSKDGKSSYIGKVSIKRTYKLVPCQSNCSRELTTD